VRPSLAGLARGPLPGLPATPPDASAEPARSRHRAGSRPPGVLPRPRASDARGPGAHGGGGPDLRTTVALLPTPRASDGVKGSPRQRGSHGDLTLPAAGVLLDTDRARRDAGGWGVYQAAVDRWAGLLDRPAPPPVQPGTTGRPVLAPAFVEWLMGLPADWVCALGLPRTVALRLLGNGVVPQQAAAALRALLVRHTTAAVRP